MMLRGMFGSSKNQNRSIPAPPTHSSPPVSTSSPLPPTTVSAFSTANATARVGYSSGHRQCPMPLATIHEYRQSTWYAMYETANKYTPYEQAKNGGLGLLMLLGTAIIGYTLYRDDTPTEVLDESVLNDQSSQANLLVISSDQLCTIDTAVAGRSHPEKVNVDQVGIYFHKIPFSREKFLNELILGALIHQLYIADDCVFPKIDAVERVNNGDNHQAMYSMISENIGGNCNNLNLVDFCAQKNSKEVNSKDFNNMGVILAFAMLFGNSDCNMRNFIHCDHRETPYLYGIDNEFAFVLDPTFLTSASEALNFIVEFNPANASRFTHFTNNPNRDLAPVFITAIQADIDNHAVLAFYQKFAGLSEDQISGIISRFGKLIHQDEQDSYQAKIVARQKATRAFLNRVSDEQLNVSMINPNRGCSA